MPNEQTTVPLFVASEVLTAADMNLSAGTGTPVFSNSTTRDAGFGGAGEKVLAEGQLCYLSSTNVVQYYDGAAWATVGPSSAGGLVCVKAETALSGASTTADGVFTSAYTNYRIVGRYTNGADALRFQLGAATVYTTTNYNNQEQEANNTTVSASRSLSQTSARIAGGSNGAFLCMFTIELSGPQLADATIFQSSTARHNGAYGAPTIELQYGNQSASTQFDGIKFLTISGTLGGSFAIYGYSKTV